MASSSHHLFLFPYHSSFWSLLAACGSGSRSSGATPVSGPPPPSASGTPAGQPTAVSRLQMQLHLRGLQNSASDLRGQLQQLRKLQVPSPPPLTYSPQALPHLSLPSISGGVESFMFSGLSSDTFSSSLSSFCFLIKPCPSHQALTLY